MPCWLMWPFPSQCWGLVGLDDASHPKSHEGLAINFLECKDVEAELNQDTSKEEE